MHYSRFFILTLLCCAQTTHSRSFAFAKKVTTSFFLGATVATTYVNNQRVGERKEVITFKEISTKISNVFTHLKTNLETYLTSKDKGNTNETRKK